MIPALLTGAPARRLLCLALLAGCGGAGGAEIEDEPDWTGAGGRADEAAGPLVIAEVFGDPETADAEAGAWIELLNRGDRPVDLAGWWLGVGRSRYALGALGDASSVVAPRGRALIVDADADADADRGRLARLPVGVALATPAARDLDDLLALSRRLTLRDPARAVADRVDATRSREQGAALERRPDGRLRRSPLGPTPGARNGDADVDSLAASPLWAGFSQPRVDPDNALRPAFVALLDGARATLDGAFYQIGDREIIDAFVRATERGVRVRLVTDTRYYTDPGYLEGYRRLEAAGVEVKQDGRSTRMHHKFVIADGREVWTGSFNLVPDAIEVGSFTHADNALVLRDAAIAAIHQTEFDELWSGRFSIHKVDDGVHEGWLDGARVEVYFAPKDGQKARILERVRRARANVYFAAFAFSQTELADALIERAAAGVDVRGVFDRVGGNSEGSQRRRLLEAGVDVRLPDEHIFLHHKFIVVDYGGDDPTVITGSYNFSDRADRQNDESVVLVHDRAVAAAYHEVFRRMHERSSPPAGPPARPALAITEVHAVPRDGRSEWIELANLGAAPIALGDLVLDDRDAVTALPDATLPAGARAVIAAEDATVTVPAAAVLVRVPRLGDGLDPTDPLVLRTRAGVPATGFDQPGYAGRGRSLHRADPGAPDLDAAWSAGAPSPGR